MRTIGKNWNGTFWVRYNGVNLGNFKSYAEAKKAKAFSDDPNIGSLISRCRLKELDQWMNK